MTDLKKENEKFDDIMDIFHSEIEIHLKSIFCSACLGRVSQLSESPNILKCTTKKCRKKRLLFSSEPFFNSNLSWENLCKIIFLFAYNYSTKEISLIVNVSKKSIRNITKIVGDKLNPEYTIGGENIVVEIDESKFGKRKYNKGHKVDGVWVVGMVERTKDRNIILFAVKKRNGATLNSLITKFVKKKTIIYTDCWKGYNDLKSLNYIHSTVNHSKFFKDPETLVHTNTIEGTWSAVKKQIPSRCRSFNAITRYLNLFMFNRKYDAIRFRMLI